MANRQRLIILLVVVAVIVAAVWWEYHKRGEEKEVEPLVTVQVAEVKPVDLTASVTVDAVLWPINQAAITPKISAPVAEFHVQRGAHVKKGDLLVTLENRDLAAGVTENKGA